MSAGLSAPLGPGGRILLTAASVFALVALAIALFGQRSPGGRGPLWRTSLVQVGVVGWILLPALSSRWAWAGAMLLMGVAVLREAHRVRALGGTPVLSGLSTALGMAVVAVGLSPDGAALLAPAGLLAVPALLLLLRSPRVNPSHLTGTLLGLAYPAYGLACLTALGLGENGGPHVFFLFAVTEIQDSTALLAGKFWGRRLIFPRLSPKKTWTGTLAGAGGALAAALAAGLVAPLRPAWAALLLGLVVGGAGLAGDLFASAMKRRAGVKDFGDAVPTMGGVLDVYDSLLFAAPFYLILVRAGL